MLRKAEEMRLNQRPFLVSDEWARQTKRWPTQSCHLHQKFTKVTTRNNTCPIPLHSLYLIKLFSASYPEENFGRQTQTQTQTNRHRHRHRTKRKQQDKIRDHEHRQHTCLSFLFQDGSNETTHVHRNYQDVPNLFMTFGRVGVRWGGWGGRWCVRCVCGVEGGGEGTHRAPLWQGCLPAGVG